MRLECQNCGHMQNVRKSEAILNTHNIKYWTCSICRFTRNPRPEGLR